MKIAIKQGQSLLDIAIQVYGDATRAFDLAKNNEEPLTEKLTSGKPLDATPDTSHKIVRFYRENGTVPATFLTQTNETTLKEDIGIGEMIIGTNFKIR